jgi:hypothetical protein
MPALTRRGAAVATATLAVAAALIALALGWRPAPAPEPAASRASAGGGRDRALRERLYQALQPVRLANCTLERIGEPRDGGYLMCGNLLQADAGYSYGISGYDGWGCEVSTRLGAAVHQYDCFDTRAPRCEGGRMTFHPECIAATPTTDADGRPFDSLASQIRRNGHAGRRLLVKMDVEGAEWESLLQTPVEVLETIDQLAIEMHGDSRDTWTQFLVVSRLKDHFHVAHLHFNNYGCGGSEAPFPSYAWEVLFVNKRLGVLATDQTPVARPHPLDAPNNPAVGDCQYATDTPGGAARR